MDPLAMRRALLVGIDDYDSCASLTGCAADAIKMRDTLARNEDGSPNFDCRLITNPGSKPITRHFIRDEWQRLFHDFMGDILFYFSGHGTPTEIGGHLVLKDGTSTEPGVPMLDLLLLANESKARDIVLILDCCFGGQLTGLTDPRGLRTTNRAQLREGLTILAASRPDGIARVSNGHGVFTGLVLDALVGGAADIRGYISVASIYAFVDQALSAWEQRPLYMSHVYRMYPIRRCKPSVSDELLRELPLLFPTPDSRYRLKPSYAFTHESATREKVEVFDKFKTYRDARLLRTVKGEDLIFTALKSRYVELTSLGRFYWRLARSNRL